MPTLNFFATLWSLPTQYNDIIYCFPVAFTKQQQLFHGPLRRPVAMEGIQGSAPQIFVPLLILLCPEKIALNMWRNKDIDP